MLLALSFVLGAALTLTMLPLSVIIGHDSFWDFPQGTVPGGLLDMAQTMVGYRYYSLAPWTLPILNIPNLVPPSGTNLLWLDAVPLLCLFGKLVFLISGAPVNLVGIFLFFCFALPGVAMTAVFWVAGQRGLFCAIVAAALADSMPFLLFEWGHVALCAQFLLIVALLMYMLSQRRPSDKRVIIGWIGLLLVTLLTNNYLFVMVGSLWSAALLERLLNRRARTGAIVKEAVAAIGVVGFVAALMGLLSWDLRFAGSEEFGVFSMNLGSPFVPQLSGALPPLATYWIGMRSQVFDYLGLGILLICVTGLPLLVQLRRARSHIALISVLLCFFLFALSNKITLGSHTLLLIPLPEQVMHTLGALRASGRFFWPVGYAATIAGTLVILRSFPSRAAIAVLTAASLLQVTDTFFQRAAIAESVSHPVPAVLDRERTGDVIARSHGISMFPTYGCIGDGLDDEAAKQQFQSARQEQAAVELQMLASRHGLPINSVITDRIKTDCVAEKAVRGAKLQRDVAYFYLAGGLPSAAQLAGEDAAKVCGSIDWLRYCLVPSGPER